MMLWPTDVRPADPDLRHNMLGMTEAGGTFLLHADHDRIAGAVTGTRDRSGDPVITPLRGHPVVVRWDHLQSSLAVAADRLATIKPVADQPASQVKRDSGPPGARERMGLSQRNQGRSPGMGDRP